MCCCSVAHECWRLSPPLPSCSQVLNLYVILTITFDVGTIVFYVFSSFHLLSPVWLSGTPWNAACRLPFPSETPRACSKSCPSSQWHNPTISSLVIPFFSCLQSLPASGSFQMSQLFASGGQSIGASASASVLPMNTQGWFSLGLTGLISLQSKGLSKVFSSTTVQKHQFFGSQTSLVKPSQIQLTGKQGIQK